MTPEPWMADQEAAALYQAVLAKPADDAPRLILADAIQDLEANVPCDKCNGTGTKDVTLEALSGPRTFRIARCEKCRGQGYKSNTFALRAELIRVQCELARGTIRADELGLRMSRILRPEGTPDNSWGSTYWEWIVSRLPSGVKAQINGGWILSRGFVSEVHMPFNSFFGLPCPANFGDGHHTSAGRLSGHVWNCEECGGLGRVGGLAKELFEANPIEKVVITDAIIHESGGNDTYYMGGLGALPFEYHRRVDGLRSRHAVKQAISSVCVDLGRKLAGLPSLSEPEADTMTQTTSEDDYDDTF